MKREDSHLELAFGKTLPILRELTPEQWAQGARLIHEATGQNLLWDFTGGEPIIYRGLPEMLSLVASFSQWAITSNSSIRERIEAIFATGINPSSWTASWHPMALGANIDTFVDNLRFIRDHGVYTSVTMVLHPSTAHCIKEHLERFAAEGFVRQVHMHLGGIETEITETPTRAEVAAGLRTELAEVARSIEHLSRPPADDWARTPDHFPPPNDCIAGYRSVAVSSDGAVFPCYNAMMVESDPPIGRWGEWVPNTEPTRDCTWNCVFGCDLRNILPATPI